MRYDNSILSPGSLVWRTIGMVALYAVVVVILYLLFFHFAAIKRIFSRENYKDYGGRGTYVNGKEINNKKPASKKTPVEKSKGPVVEAEIVEEKPNETQEESQQSTELEAEESAKPEGEENKDEN